MNVVGCASLIAEMVLLFEWDIEDDDMQGGFAVLRDMQRDDPDALPAFVTRVNLATFTKAYLAVRARIDDISDVWMCEMRRHLVQQFGTVGWQAELMPITH